MSPAIAAATPIIYASIFPDGNPFFDHLGVEWIAAADGVAELALTLRAQHMNSWQITHGGVSMTLIDVAMAVAGSSLSPTQQSCVTVDMHTQFLQAAGRLGDRLIVRAKAVHRSASLCFCEAQVWQGEQLVVRGSATFKYLKRHNSELDSGAALRRTVR